ncbi:hypothetical protein, partial [Pseudomonas sp. MPR-AND1A]|uniref:hypothetical protein n=1 Tax=Pseudomonas sp. MPR-AND1A TaxID=2070600 RepID=UPI001C478F84
RHCFYAQPWFDRLNLRAQQLGQMRVIARRSGRSDPNCLPVPIDASEMTIEPTSSFAQRGQLDHDVGD